MDQMAKYEIGLPWKFRPKALELIQNVKKQMGLSLYSTICKDPMSRKKIKRYTKYTKGVKWQNSRKSTKNKK